MKKKIIWLEQRLACLQSGFTNEELENMDLRLQAYIYNFILEREKQKRILMQLDIAEAINFAYTGSRSKKGQQEFLRWIENKKRQIIGDSRPSVWDLFKKYKKEKNK